jgi:alkanesulfonate monooxygenase SsuD/methylene tetrahydromethanopterin reductase-like flavin-dependent oxidoreductase (luciferase family)
MPAIEPFAKLVKETSLHRLWLGQSLILESHQSFAYLAGRGLRIPVGIGVTLIPFRHPVEAAVQARSLARLTGHPIVAGYGPATPGMVAALRGAPYDKPGRASAEYARAVRGLLDETPSLIESEAFYQSELSPLEPMSTHPPVEVGLGVLRPGMARAAGGTADVAITWMTPPGYVRDTLIPALAQGAAKHGRDQVPRVATVVHVAVARPGRDPRKIALAGAGKHLSLPHYTDMLRQAGVPAEASNSRAGANALLDKGVYLYGSPEEIAKGLMDYEHAGVSEIIINPCGTLVVEGLRSTVRDLEEITTAVEALRD